MAQPLVSVIFPVYNIPDDVLTFSLESILNQTHHNLEIIIINDCSPLSSNKDLLERYASIDSRIKLINLDENKGVSNARNIGIDSSQGEYVTIVDSDDYLDPDFIQKLVVVASTDHMEIVAGGIKREDGNKQIIFTDKNSFTINLKNDNDRIKAIQIISNSSCCKLYRRETIGNVRFNSNCRHYEDYLFLWQVLLNAKNISSDENVFYHYVLRDGSASQKVMDENKILSIFESFRHHLEFILRIKKEEKHRIFAEYLYFYVLTLCLFDHQLYTNPKIFELTHVRSGQLELQKQLDLKNQCRTFLSQKIILKYSQNPASFINTAYERLTKLCCLYEMYYTQYQSMPKTLKKLISRIKTKTA